MTGRGRLTKAGEKTRDEVEQVLFDLSANIDLQDEVSLRIRQAMQRTALVVDVLDPALERLERMRSNICRARGFLGSLWQKKKRERWEDDCR